jgi:hypothetical protein
MEFDTLLHLVGFFFMITGVTADGFFDISVCGKSPVQFFIS